MEKVKRAHIRVGLSLPNSQVQAGLY
uniref:Uncharacterized protein n=1 Tax=Anguilla anguilla TaxID=7936 RepID=A0A0E9S3Q3_ANGAN